MDADEIYALLGPRSEHAIEQITRLKRRIAKPYAAPAAGLDFVERIALIKHIPAAAAAVEVVATDCIAVFDTECADMGIGDKAQCAEADLVDVMQRTAERVGNINASGRIGLAID